MCLVCSRKSKKKLIDEIEDVKSPPSIEPEPLARQEEEEESSAITPNNVAEPDDWSDTPLSALKDESADQDAKSTIEATIRAVSEGEYKDDDVPPAAVTTPDNRASSPIPETTSSASVKTEKSNDAPEDDTSSTPKSAQTTPQSNKKRRSKTSRSKSSK